MQKNSLRSRKRIQYTSKGNLVAVVTDGAGAAGAAISKLLLSSGVKNLIAIDKVGILYRGMEKIDDAKEALAEITNPDNIKGGLSDALVGADLFVGVSAPGILKQEMVKSMNKDAIIFAMANPTPEIMPDEAKAAGAKVIGTGRSDFPIHWICLKKDLIVFKIIKQLNKENLIN